MKGVLEWCIADVMAPNSWAENYVTIYLSVWYMYIIIYTNRAKESMKEMFKPCPHLTKTYQKNKTSTTSHSSHPPSNLYLHLFPAPPKKHPHCGFHVCLFPVHHWRVIASKTGTFVAGSWVLLGHLDDLLRGRRKRRRGKRWPETKMEMVEKNGKYNMVKLKLALIGVYYRRILLVCCHCCLDFALQICLSVNLPYIS